MISSEFSITSEFRDTTLIIKTGGYINNTGGEKILKEFTSNFSDATTRVIMDLERSSVVNSIGISYLIEVIEQIVQNNSKIIFRNLDPAVEKTFEIMGLFQFAEKADSADPVY